MLVFPNAKINIGLNITEKRTDGYHNIESCFYPINWSDVLEVTPAEQFSFNTDGSEIPGNNLDNLCVKAYQMLAADFALAPVSLHLLKIIPIGAGLGGGSSDAAFTIKALDQYFNLQISFEKQQEYARRLGSDCAFFIRNEPAYCYEKGDKFEDIELNISGRFLVLVNPGIHISTIEAYSGIKPTKTGADLRRLINQPIKDWKHTIKNDFEATLFPKYPLLRQIKENLYNHGALYASMSGSGSTIYGIFENEVDLSKSFAQFTLRQETIK